MTVLPISSKSGVYGQLELHQDSFRALSAAAAKDAAAAAPASSGTSGGGGFDTARDNNHATTPPPEGMSSSSSDDHDARPGTGGPFPATGAPSYSSAAAGVAGAGVSSPTPLRRRSIPGLAPASSGVAATATSVAMAGVGED